MVTVIVEKSFKQQNGLAYRDEALNLIPNEVYFHAGEAMIKKHEKWSLLFQRYLLLLTVQA